MTPFEDDAGIAKLEQRLGVLVRQHKVIAPGMSDLPLYNAKVSVEAVDFLPFGDMGFGALVTPWFINAVFLPLKPVAYDLHKVGRTAVVELPAGQRSFTLGGDEVTGLIWTHAIMSPLSQITSHDAAVIVARAKLAELLTRPEEEPSATEQPAERSRRDVLFGNPDAEAAA